MAKKTCPMCESQTTEIISTYTSGGYNFRHCFLCDGIFADPMQSGGKEWYEKSEWYFFPSAALESLNWYEAVFLKEFASSKNKNVLNIGCGRNIFLKKIKELGCHVTAVDINEKIIDFTKNILGIEDVYSGDIVDFTKKYKGNKYDMVVFFEVLEHTENPKEFLECLKNILKEDGKVVFSVPNRERIIPYKDTWDYPPHHLTRWNNKSLERFLDINGYVLEKIKISPFTADSFVRLLKSNFNTSVIEEKIQQSDAKKSDPRITKAFLFKMLFKVRMLFYRIIEIMGMISLRKKGKNIYAVAKVKKRCTKSV